MPFIQPKSYVSESEHLGILEGAIAVSTCLTDVDSGRVIRRPMALTFSVEAVSGIKQFVKDHKNVTTSTVVAAAVAVVVGGVIISVTQFRKCRKCSARLSNALSRYFDAVRNGTVSMPVLNELLRALTLYKDVFSNIKCRSLIPCAAIDKLCVFALDYTKQLVDTNSIAFEDIKVRKRDNNIVQLQEYVDAQRRIIVSANGGC